jgi:hypothetical protein
LGCRGQVAPVGQFARPGRQGVSVGESLRVAVIGDIHANILGLEGALAAIAARGFDHLVINGDLLTYGSAALPVLDLIGDLVAGANVTLLAGNHDLLYTDPSTQGTADGARARGVSQPHWLTESIEWTRERAGVPEGMKALPWRPELVLERVLFAHANPFGARNWTYIRSATDVARAMQTLEQRGLRGGIFGHVHRSSFHDGRDDIAVSSRFHGCNGAEEFSFAAPDSGIVLGVGGSVGQPRGGAAVAEYTILEIGAQSISISFGGVPYDLDRHLSELRNSGVSSATADRLSHFFLGA